MNTNPGIPKVVGLISYRPLSRDVTHDELTDLNYWIKHPFEFSDPILKPEYL